MTKAQIETLIKMMAVRMHRESRLLWPDPQFVLHGPYDILKWIDEQGLATGKEIDRWMCEAQDKEES